MKFKRTQAFAAPLITTAIAAHSAIWLKRGSANLRSLSGKATMEKIPPTQSESATTCTASEPTAS